MADPNGIVARTVAALRYAWTGNMDWFGPLDPLPDQAPPEVKGRAWDYPVGSNLNYVPRKAEPISFHKLKNLANNCGPLKLVMGRQRDLVKALEWSIKPKAKQAKGAAIDPQIAAITAILEYPDREHDWSQWINGFLDQLFVIDALTIYPRKTRGGDLYALELIDGATITPLIDSSGRRPVAPDEAYQQILKGLPAVHYSTDEIIYYPENYRVDRIYGYSRVEMLVDEVETMIARLKSQKGFFERGNIGKGFFEAPPTYNPDQTKALETHWNALMSSDGGRRLADQNQVPWVPSGTKFNETKIDIFEPAFDEWLIRLICFLFDVAPTPFLKQAGLGHGSATTDKEASEEGGIAQLKQLIRRLMNRILAVHFQRPDLEFAWQEDNEPDPKTAADIANTRLRNGSLTINRYLDRMGEDRIEGGDDALIYTATGAVKLADVIDPPPPPPPSVQLVPGQDADAIDDKTPANDDGPPGKLAKEAGGDDQAKFTNLIASYLSKRGAIIAKQIADALGIATPDAAAIANALDGVDWDWSDLADSAETILSGIAVSAGTEAVSKLGLFDKDTLAKVSERATAYAADRAAELVGMKVVDGELVDNPDAAWSISSATRDMLRGTITNAVEAGASNDTLAKDIADSAAFSRERAMTIARTETAKADVQGSRAGWKVSGLVAGRQWLAGDGCCDECQALDGEIVGIDEEFPDGDAPLHPNCLPGDSLVAACGDISGVSQRWYDGDLVVINTAAGHHLSCTPNHPVLTSSGWVAARHLDLGGDVISCRLGDGITIDGGDHENMPARIEDVAEAFRRSEQVAAVPVPVSAEDFHGDGKSSEVAIIWTDRALRHDANATICKHCGKDLLVVRDVEFAAHHSSGAPNLLVDRVRAPGRGGVGSLDLGAATFGAHAFPGEAPGVAHTAPSDAPRCQNARDDAAGDPEVFGDALFSAPGEVRNGNRLLVDGGSGSDSNTSLGKGASYDAVADPEFAANPRDIVATFVKADSLSLDSPGSLGASEIAALAQGARDSAHGKPELSADFSKGFPGPVFVDHIVNVARHQFSGHVYNLDTAGGYYIAEGIVTHNCECTELAVLPEDMPDGAESAETDD
jgi:SPP1 gp7 family putative phage head morphogenesis protein